ncbi:MAG: Gfo/Idh/MocA family oxidoreductase [Pirellulales bacterium]|nr:Gfo/Idh/MocA family oxidoreductase [Pirellulales bacterium]
MKSFSRRNFLRGTAALATAVPYFWTSAQAKAESANDRLGVGVIGVGGRGTVIGLQAAKLGHVVACADVERRNADRFVAKLRKTIKQKEKCSIHNDYRRLLDRKDVDVITCGTPDHWHTKIALDAMAAGKDVYCEKPLTLTMDESRQIREAVKRTGRVFQVGTQQRTEYKSMFLKAVAIARSGRLGKKLHAISSVGQSSVGGPFEPQPVPKTLDWNRWLGQAPVVDFTPNRVGWNFRWWLEYAGGMVTDWGVHHTDIALWALGGETTGIVQVEGQGTFPGLPADLNLFDFLNGKAKIPPLYNTAQTFDCHMRLPNGNTIRLLSQKNELILEGEKGKIRVNRNSLTGKPIEDIDRSPTERDWLDAEVLKLCKGRKPGDHMRDFFDCVRDRAEPISDVFTHTRAVDACHMANIAMLLKRKLNFDPKKHSFVGDDQANALMRRKQRAPFGTKV